MCTEMTEAPSPFYAELNVESIFRIRTYICTCDLQQFLHYSFAVVLLLLFLLPLLSIITGVGGEKIRKHEQFKKQTCHCPKAIEQEVNDSNEAPMDAHCNCLIAGFGINKKIPYPEFSSLNDPIDIRFSSACLRCGMCLAIAEQLNQRLSDIYHATPCTTCLDDNDIIQNLRAVCNCSFEHFRLREIEGKRLICGRTPGANLIATSADHLWEKNLRETCHGYLDEIGEVQLYKRWRQWFDCKEGVPDMATLLCRSDVGMTRDCRCIEKTQNTESSTSPPETSCTNVKILARYPPH